MVLPRYVVLVRWSKNCLYETPYRVIGMIQLTGLENPPKSVNVQIEFSERGKLTTWRSY